MSELIPNNAVRSEPLALNGDKVSAAFLAALSLTDNIEIKEWLFLHAGEHYLVVANLEIIYTDQPLDRNALSLQALVQKISGGNCSLVFVDSAVISTVFDLIKAPLVKGPEEQSTDVVRQVLSVLHAAVDNQASDVHVRIRDHNCEVLFRIYGMLNSYQKYSRPVGLRLVRACFNHFARTHKDFSEFLPMDGVFYFDYKNMRYGVRMNLMNEVRGCTMVMRIRGTDSHITLSESGYTDTQFAMVRTAMRQSAGLMLLCGPTNSGKSTTLSNLLGEVTIERNVISIEDPVEIKFELIAHIDLSKQPKEVSLQDLLACTVRQDPDMLVLAEIRDIKTARYAENMSLQGRFVASTLHAENIAAIPMRLLRLGMEEANFFVPGFFNILVAQSLVPLNCTHCCLDRHTDKTMEKRYRTLFKGSTDLRYRNVGGCTHCHKGIVGRTLLAEVLLVDREIRALFKQCDYDGINDYMRANNISSRHQHAQAKIGLGLIDPELVEERIGAFNSELLQ